MKATRLQRFTVTYRGHAFTVSARSEQAIIDALETIKEYAATLIPIA